MNATSDNEGEKTRQKCGDAVWMLFFEEIFRLRSELGRKKMQKSKVFGVVGQEGMKWVDWGEVSAEVVYAL